MTTQVKAALLYLAQACVATEGKEEFERRLRGIAGVRFTGRDTVEFESESARQEAEGLILRTFEQVRAAELRELDVFEALVIGIKEDLVHMDEVLGRKTPYEDNMINGLLVEWRVLYSRAQRNEEWGKFCESRGTPTEYDFWDLFDGSEDEG